MLYFIQILKKNMTMLSQIIMWWLDELLIIDNIIDLYDNMYRASM